MQTNRSLMMPWLVIGALLLVWGYCSIPLARKSPELMDRLFISEHFPHHNLSLIELINKCCLADGIGVLFYTAVVSYYRMIGNIDEIAADKTNADEAPITPNNPTEECAV